MRAEIICYSYQTCLQENNLSLLSQCLHFYFLYFEELLKHVILISPCIYYWDGQKICSGVSVPSDEQMDTSISILRLLSLPWRGPHKVRALMKLWVWGWETERLKKEELGSQDHSTNVGREVMVFPVVMYGCESWTVMTAGCRTTDAFELWWWRRLLRVLWTARRSNQSIVIEISPGCALEGLMLKLKLQYVSHHMQSVDSLEKTLKLGGVGGIRRRGWQRMRWLDGLNDSMDMGLRRLWELVMNRKARYAVTHGVRSVGHPWATELNWTEQITVLKFPMFS